MDNSPTLDEALAVARKSINSLELTPLKQRMVEAVYKLMMECKQNPLCTCGKPAERIFCRECFDAEIKYQKRPF